MRMWIHLPYICLLVYASAACIEQSTAEFKDFFNIIPQRLREKHLPRIRIAKINWPQSNSAGEIMSAIARILINEKLGYENVEYVHAASPSDALSMVSRGDAEINLEAWYEHLVHDAQEAGKVVDFGPAGYDGQAGIYVRPSRADRALVEHHRWYEDFFQTFSGKVLSADALMKYCGVSCMTWSQCKGESVCPGIVVVGASGYAKQHLQDMLVNGSIKASVVFLSPQDQKNILEKTEDTVLLYEQVPMAPARGMSHHVRLNFENPGTCDLDVFLANNTNRYACDFKLHRITKIGSSNFDGTYADVAFLVQKMSFSSDDLSAIWSTSDERKTAEELACSWILTHERIWQEWIRSAHINEGMYSHFKYWLSLFVVTFLFLTLWLFAPFFRTKPYTNSDPNYYGPAEFWFYTAMWPGFFISFFTSLCGYLSIDKIRALRTNNHDAESHQTNGADRSAVSWRSVLSAGSPKVGRIRGNQTKSYLVVGSEDEDDSSEDSSEEGASPLLAPALPISDANFSTKERLAGAAVIGHWRGGAGGNHEAVAREIVLLTEGMQFSQSVFYGTTGDEEFKIGLIRGAGTQSERSIRVEIENIDGTAVQGTDYELESSTLHVQRGDRFVELGISLYEAEHRMSMASVWSPTRSFQLKLAAFDTSTGTPVRLGSASTCKVVLIEMQQWPCPDATSMSNSRILRHMAWETLKGNFKREFWWFVGMSWRAFSVQIVDPVLIMLLVNDVLVLGSMHHAFILVTIKLFFELSNHYCTYWFSVGGPISYVKPWFWIFAKWGCLPLEQTRNAETQLKFQGFAERIDTEYCSNTYFTVTGRVQYFVNLGLNMLSMYILSPNFQIACCSNLVILAIALALYLYHRCGSNRYRIAHEGEWESHMKFLVERTFYFQNAELQNYQTAEKDANSVMTTRRGRTIRRDEQWFISSAQGSYINWIISLLWISLLFMSPLLVDFKTFTTGSIVAVLGQLSSAGSKLADLASNGFKLVIAGTAVKDFSNLLNHDTDKYAALAQCTAEVHQEHLREISRSGVPCLQEIRFVNCVVSSDALREACGGNFVVKCNGSCPVGGIYGLAHGKVGDVSIRSRILLDVVGGLRIPSQGAVLLPPSARAIVVSTDVTTIPIQYSVIDNLRYGLEQKSSTSESMIWALCQALGMDSQIFSSKCGHLPLSELLWMIEPLDRIMMNLVRALICMPDVLVVHFFGHLEPRRSKMMEIVLRNFADGNSFCSLIRLRSRGATGPKARSGARMTSKFVTKHATCRTVFWTAERETLARLDKVLAFNPSDGKLSVSLRGGARHA